MTLVEYSFKGLIIIDFYDLELKYENNKLPLLGRLFIETMFSLKQHVHLIRLIKGIFIYIYPIIDLKSCI